MTSHTMRDDPPQPDTEPETTRVNNWAMWSLSSAYILAGSSTPNYSRVLRLVETEQELRYMAAKIALVETCITPFWLDTWNLPRLETPTFWITGVLPAIRKELDRRTRPARTWGANSPIAKIKAENTVEEVAERVTQLTKAGAGFKGLCPFHKERSPSFYVWPDSQRWKCFGACATGGDVVDLLRMLGDRGRSA